MEIRVDGSRATSENWMRASIAPDLDLPKLSEEEKAMAKTLGVSSEDYARSRFAIELTDFELRDKAQKLASFMLGWLSSKRISASIASVWLKTFEGKYKFEFVLEGRLSQVVLDESLVDEILERGSIQAKVQLENVLEMNILPMTAARAS